MSEKIISPGVFTNENDKSFLTQGVGVVGAVVVGPTAKGPAFVPTLISNGYNEYIAKFGNDTSNTYTPHTVKDYLTNASSVTVVRVLGNGGWSFTSTRTLAAIVVSGSGAETNGFGNNILAVLHPSKNSSPNSLGLESSSISPSTLSISGSFILTLSGSGFSSAQSLTASLNKTSVNFITKTLGKNQNNSLSGSIYKPYAFPYLLFRDLANTTSSFSGSKVLLITSSQQVDFTASIDGNTYSEGYTYAMTPWVTDGNSTTPSYIFRFASLSHGFATNNDVYVSITDLQEPADINGLEQFSTFTVLVRAVGDSDKQPTILESYTNVSLDPNAANFIARVIGDRYYEFNSTLSKIVTRGNYANASSYIRVVMGNSFNADLTLSSLSPKASPRGFERFYQTITGFGTTFNLPPVIYKTSQTIDSSFNSKAFLGFDFSVGQDNLNYLNPVPTVAGVAVLASQSAFTVNSLNGHPSASWVGSLSASIDISGVAGPTSAQLQFSLPMQGGSDGVNFATIQNLGSDISATNVFGYDLSSAATAGAKSYIKAINLLSNRDEYDFNILVLPGILNSLHSAVTSTAITMVENRADAFYIMDLIDLNASVTQAANGTSGLTSNYTGVYYPWVKIIDANLNKPVFVPPSVVLPGAFALNDKTAGAWFAAAGLNRGGLGQVLETRNKLSQSERDVLYSNRVNPIAQFPGVGVAVYGQKTLQVKSSALDRINVRRLLIELKKFISTASKSLVFEQNTAVTRNRFLNIVNPYLDSIQQRQGLYGYRVVMDDTNNTADVIDRNQLVGAIYIQPTKTAEFIVLDFNILPTGTTFGQ